MAAPCWASRCSRSQLPHGQVSATAVMPPRPSIPATTQPRTSTSTRRFLVPSFILVLIFTLLQPRTPAACLGAAGCSVLVPVPPRAPILAPPALFALAAAGLGPGVNPSLETRAGGG